ncbi:hypothetical protein BU16DRAFT_523574 [Lophium mytilinum]|uniref:Cell division control protein n=1 Tax=Lophium mytilinum TaxID=390894 RepID=A0A6A6RAQ3_9PEZI|nr:hypothetical protein BU16DRAFT_523574 [Lophium mytilinum]
MPGTSVSEPPSVSLSFANNFWGKDDAGVSPLLERLHNAKVTGDELKSFYTTRAAIEDEYSRKLLNLSRKPLGSSEAGTLRMSLDIVRGEVESMGKSHQNIAGQMKSELEEPLAAFAGGMKERRKIVQSGIEKLLKTKTQQTMTVNKARDRYEQDCLKIKGFLAQAHMVMGQEERKNKAKLEKTQIQLSSTSSDYEAAVKVLEETTGRWNRDWKAGCDKFQDLEEERIDFMKASLWTFANIASTVCVSDDASCERIRLSLEDCDVEKDIMGFIKDAGTGQEIPDPPKFINFCRGDVNDNASETSDDGNYSVAQFQRTMNPAFRSSSPQPSVFESHHDPSNPLAKELGLKEPQVVPDTEPLKPQQPQRPQQPQQPQNPPSSRGIQPDPRLIQAQQQARQQYQQSQYEDVPKVSHNEFPMDGMTQFCRPGAPSERGNPSPVRPSSRDSHSDYSGGSNFSNIDLPSGSNSPGKPMAPIAQPLDDRQIQKKKSGFFQGHSPFRRRSKHEKEPPQAAVTTPSSRNTWAPPSRRSNNENISPTRQQGYGQGARGILGGEGRSASPEPVDPRANFQLNIGNNVFDVASPDKRKQKQQVQSDEPEELDPIAQALAELKGVTKQTSVRMSADRYHGLSTPAPPATPGNANTPVGGILTPLANGAVNAAKRGTPPPSYEQPPMSRLGAPQPAHTARQMQQTTQRYLDQKTSMFNTGATQRNSGSNQNPSSRPTTRGVAGQSQEVVRAPSPGPPRATSPRPGLYQTPSAQAPQTFRAPSPNPYAASNAGGRPRAQSSSPIKQYNRDSYTRGGSPGQAPIPRAVSPNPSYGGGRQVPASRDSYSHGGSPAQAPIPRAVSPNPSYGGGRQVPVPRNSYTRNDSPAQAPVPRAVSPNPAAYSSSRQGPASRPASRAVSPAPQFRQSYDRPSSSRGSDMALQLAPGPGSERGEGSVYGGSQRSRGGGGNPRPQSAYYAPSEAGYSSAGGGGGTSSSNQVSARVRSQSVAEPRQYTKEGRMIMHYARAMYMYQAQIPEELSFAKGDILAVLRLQDDGWWEAQVIGKNGRPGLVPSNYLQNC